MDAVVKSTPLKDSTKYTLWVIAGVYLIFIVVTGVTNIIPPRPWVSINTGLLFIFAIVHGLSRYRFKDFFVFFCITFLVSNFFENMGVLTGFPFSAYHYTSLHGKKLFEVPINIAPCYFAAGYLSWTLAHILLNIWNKRFKKLDFFFIPVVATFIMVSWDLCIDPLRSTVNHQWIWQHGGSYFGVPIVNFAGWFLCVYVYNQLFALYLLRVGGSTGFAQRPFTKAQWYQAALVYFTLGLITPLQTIFIKNTLVIDPGGTTWGVANIYKSMTLITVFTMWFIALLCAIKIYRKTNDLTNHSTEHS